MKAKATETVLEGVLIAVGAGFLTFVWQMISTPPALQASLQSVADNNQASRLKAEFDTQRCHAFLDVQIERVRLLGEARDAQQVTVNSDQTQLNAQQGVVAQCVVSLGKMHPKVREQISVIKVQFADLDHSARIVNKEKFVEQYLTEVFVITNEPEPRFHGSLQCDNSFQFTENPQITTSAASVVLMTAAPNRISDREYEIRVDASATEWNASHPAYMQVISHTPTLGKCTFTPME